MEAKRRGLKISLILVAILLVVLAVATVGILNHEKELDDFRRNSCYHLRYDDPRGHNRPSELAPSAYSNVSSSKISIPGTSADVISTSDQGTTLPELPFV